MDKICRHCGNAKVKVNGVCWSCGKISLWKPFLHSVLAEIIIAVSVLIIALWFALRAIGAT